MIKFYDIDNSYIQYLKQFDRQVPDINYSMHNKFVCGIILNINNINYYAPVSSFNKKQQTNFPIRHNGQIISTIRFSFMFPAMDNVLSLKNFQRIRSIDSNYADLLSTEYNYCKSHIDDIYRRAQAVYRIGCNADHYLNKTCCNFKLLESVYTQYSQNK